MNIIRIIYTLHLAAEIYLKLNNNYHVKLIPLLNYLVERVLQCI